MTFNGSTIPELIISTYSPDTRCIPLKLNSTTEITLKVTLSFYISVGTCFFWRGGGGRGKIKNLQQQHHMHGHDSPALVACRQMSPQLQHLKQQRAQASANADQISSWKACDYDVYNLNQKLIASVCSYTYTHTDIYILSGLHQQF